MTTSESIIDNISPVAEGQNEYDQKRVLTYKYSSITI